MPKKHTKALWWVKRDFRLIDNSAFKRALTECEEVLPVFAFEPLLLGGPDWGLFHSYAVWQAEQSLRKNLQKFGSDLYVSTEDIIPTFEKLLEKYKFTAIYAYEETGLNHTFERDKAVSAWCAQHKIEFVEERNNGVVRRLRSREDWNEKFDEFIQKPLATISKSIALQNETKSIVANASSPTPEFLRIHTLPKTLPEVSEHAAQIQLKEFLDHRVLNYAGNISSMNNAIVHSSHLSMHLAWGTISLRYVFQAVQKVRDDIDQTGGDFYWERSLKAFKSRLYWHAHFIQKLEDEVAMEFVPQNRAFENALPTVNGQDLKDRLKAWEQGQTGFPIIDASMRYYQKHGWLNFRSRAMVTSFAVHALRIPWEVILYRLARFMMDYVPGIHVPQVQMQTGLTGTNTIRVYSPHKQMIDQDPYAVFIKSQIQELKNFSAEQILNFEQETLGEYLRPIVDFKTETKIMKDALYKIKKSGTGRKEADRVYKKHGSRGKFE